MRFVHLTLSSEVRALLLTELFTALRRWLRGRCFTHHPHRLCFPRGFAPSLLGPLPLSAQPRHNGALGGAVCGVISQP